MIILAISGSLRAVSVNSALLRATARLAPPGIEVRVYLDIGALPLFNPDLEDQVPSDVTALRDAVREADALIFASPEYAHGVSGVIKNTLDWLVSFEPFAHKPVAIFSASPRSRYADPALRETLQTMSASIVNEACFSSQLVGAAMSEDDMVRSPSIACEIRAALGALKGFVIRVDEYLSRIACAKPAAPDLPALEALHLSHLRTVPFENLDIHAKQEIILSEAALYAKIVGRRRGGICYELNGLFAWLLRRLGFDVAMMAANVCNGEADLTPDFDHMVLIVTIDATRYLVDVGFGDSFLLPLELEQRGVQGPGYRISLDDGFYTLSRTNTAGEALPDRPLFRFALKPRALEDFIPRCDFHQYSTESHFRRKTVCSRADGEGRITISGGELIVSRGDTRAVTQLQTAKEVQGALQEHFGIAL